MQRLILFGIVCSVLVANAQQDTLGYAWKQKAFFPVDSNSFWMVDVLENHYVFENNNITKYDSTGTFKFSQSVKSLGKPTALIPVNAMKLVHFSEEQQTLCYFDNTLTLTENCVELIDRNIVNASLVCRSSQPDKLWVLDQVNSTLSLLTMSGNSLGQQVRNLRGILDLQQVTFLTEADNKLFLLDRKKGIFIFDIYGSLIDFIDVQGGIHISASSKGLLLLKRNGLELYDLERDSFQHLELPVNDVVEIEWHNHVIFMRTSKGIYKFMLQILE